MEENNEFPKSLFELIGTKQRFTGNLFGRKKVDPTEKYKVLDIRWSDAMIIKLSTREPLRRAVELLLKNDKMKRSQWSRPFMYSEDDLPTGNSAGTIKTKQNDSNS